MFPCSLKREPRLSGTALAIRLGLDQDGRSQEAASLPSANLDNNQQHNTHEGQYQMSPPIPPTLSQTAASSSSTHDEFWLSLTGDKWESAQDQQMSHSITSLGLPLERVQANTDVSSPYCDPVSPFERIITTYEPIFQTLIAFLPTSSVFNLYHTSRYLRNHLQSYPLAWKSLSFRLPQPTNNSVTPGTNPGDITEWQSKQYALDLVLKRVVVPIALRLTSLDLCNTAISGALLVGSVLEPRKETLRHVSVRGCKNVSLKYHIVPFLHQIKIETKVWGDLRAFALKSLYTYRCRHHRRRPYLPASLARRDSDSEPTHDLIELCHQLGIWTDTAWCPTPGPRCHRRKDYHGNRAAPGTMEVWVPFDRLWRSSNRVGPSDDYSHGRPAVGKLWEEDECGHDGEALGTKDSAIFAGEGKEVPTHMRRSHRTFVEDIKCDDCEEVILERCETCSIRMHCMGCRKTLCASCAFNRPLKKKHKVMGHMEEEAQLGNHEIHSTSDQAERYWWAIGAARSPNIMTDASEDPDSDDESRVPTRVNAPTHPGPLKINMSWCCLEPLFSGGGGVAFVGPGLGGHGSERIRAVPLQQRKEYIDPDFCTDSTNSPDQSFQKFDDRLSSNVDILPYLQQASLDLQSKTCPRCLCKSCYRSFRWKVDCRACKRPICKEHDFRALKARKCGFRDLSDEREYVRNPPKQAREDMIMREAELWPTEMRIPEFRLIKAGESSVGSEASGDDERRPRQAEIENQEWSDAGSSGEGPSTRDPSSTPRALPIPHADRSSSASRGPGSSDEESRAIEPALFFPNLDLVERANIVAQSRPPLRGRSFSMSEIANSKGKGKAKLLVPHLQQTTKTPKEHMLLPCHGRHPVQWQGCGAYFCQGSRSVGDVRQRCFATGKECTECGVYVCQYCMPKTVGCACSFCDSNFHCPHCFSKPEIQSQCLREAEVRARELKIERERIAEEARLRQEMEDRKHADQITNYGGEFWGALMVPSNVQEDVLQSEAPVVTGESSRSNNTMTPADGSVELIDVEIESLGPLGSLEQLDEQAQIQLMTDLMQGTIIDDGEEPQEDVQQVDPPALAA